MTDLDRLLAEALPDGTFGGRREPKPRHLPATPPAQAAAHLRELADAIGARHLEAVPTQPDTATTRTRKAA